MPPTPGTPDQPHIPQPDIAAAATKVPDAYDEAVEQFEGSLPAPDAAADDAALGAQLGAQMEAATADIHPDSRLDQLIIPKPEVSQPSPEIDSSYLEGTLKQLEKFQKEMEEIIERLRQQIYPAQPAPTNTTNEQGAISRFGTTPNTVSEVDENVAGLRQVEPPTDTAPATGEA